MPLSEAICVRRCAQATEHGCKRGRRALAATALGPVPMASTESVALARRDRPARPLRVCSIGRLFPMIHKVDASYGPVDTTMWAKSPAAGIHFSYRKAINGPSSGTLPDPRDQRGPGLLQRVCGAPVGCQNGVIRSDLRRLDIVGTVPPRARLLVDRPAWTWSPLTTGLQRNYGDALVGARCCGASTPGRSWTGPTRPCSPS